MEERGDPYFFCAMWYSQLTAQPYGPRRMSRRTSSVIVVVVKGKLGRLKLGEEVVQDSGCGQTAVNLLSTEAVEHKPLVATAGAGVCPQIKWVRELRPPGLCLARLRMPNPMHRAATDLGAVAGRGKLSVNSTTLSLRPSIPIALPHEAAV